MVAVAHRSAVADSVGAAPSGHALSTADCAAILNATAPDQFTVQYFFGQTRTAQMYAGTRTTQLRAAREGQAVWEVGVELVEF